MKRFEDPQFAMLDKHRMWFKWDQDDWGTSIVAPALACIAAQMFYWSVLADHMPGVRELQQRAIDIRELDLRDQEAIKNRLRIEAQEEARKKKERIRREQDRVQGPVIL